MTDDMPGNYDCMVIGAHPDDAELCCGGTIAKLTKDKRKVVIVDCTEGEMGTRGTPEIRKQEAIAASNILGVSERINLGMRDGFINISEGNLFKIVQAIRHYRPKIILIHPYFERHPDHENLHRLFRDAMFKCGLKKFATDWEGQQQEIFRTRKIFCYQQAYQFPRNPDFFVDISDVIEIKLEAIRAFSSQVYVEGKYQKEAPTRLASPEFMEELTARSRYYGGLCGVKHAEAFLSIESLLLGNLSALL